MNPFASQRSQSWYELRRAKLAKPIVYSTDKVKHAKWVKKNRMRYQYEVRKMTDMVAMGLSGIELRGFDSYHIDHKVSILEGFNRGFPVSWIADVSNLRIVKCELNLEKSNKCVGNDLRMMIKRMEALTK